METFLNLLWFAIAFVALITAPQRSRRVLFALGCAAVLLFPIVSVSDDLAADRNVLEDALGVVVKAVILIIAFVTVARIESIRPRRVTLLLVPPSDPRSPPRAL